LSVRFIYYDDTTAVILYDRVESVDDVLLPCCCACCTLKRPSK